MSLRVCNTDGPRGGHTTHRLVGVLGRKSIRERVDVAYGTFVSRNPNKQVYPILSATQCTHSRTVPGILVLLN